MKKILHLASWFPTNDNPFAGNFIIRHIESVAVYADSTLINVVFNQNMEYGKILTFDKNGVHYLILNYKQTPTLFSFFDKLSRKIKRYIGFQKLYNVYRVKNGYPDLIHLHVVSNLGMLAREWSKNRHIPLVITEHSSIYQESRKSERTGYMMSQMRMIFKQATLVLPVSDSLKSHIADLKLHTQFQIIPNVVDTTIFKPDFNLMKSQKIKHILHVSTLDDHAKNITGMMRVVDKLYRQRQDFVLDIIHEKPCCQWQDKSFVSFHGSKQPVEIAMFMQYSAFFLLFSNYENLPCVLLESMACGLPVLATDVGGISEIVNSKRGVLIPPKDEVLLLNKMNWMLDNYEQFDVAEMSRFIQSNYSKQIIGLKLSEIYENITKKSV